MADRRLLLVERSGAQSEQCCGVLALEPLESRRLLNGADGVDPGLVEATQGAAENSSVLLIEVGDGVSKSLTYTEADDDTTVTVKHKGGIAQITLVAAQGETLQQELSKGKVTVTGGVGSIDVALSANSLKTQLSFKTDKVGDGQADVGSITGSGEAGTLKGKTVNLAAGGGITLADGYFASVQVNDIAADVFMDGTGFDKGLTIQANEIEGSVLLGSGLKSLKGASWTAGELRTPWAGKVTISGNKKSGVAGDLGATFVINEGDAALTGHALGTLSVADTMSCPAVSVNGTTKSITAGKVDSFTFVGTGSVDKFEVKGNNKTSLIGDVVDSSIALISTAQEQILKTFKVAASVSNSSIMDIGGGLGSVGSITAGQWGGGGGIMVGSVDKLTINGSKAGLAGDFVTTFMLGADGVTTGQEVLGKTKIGGTFGGSSGATLIYGNASSIDFGNLAGFHGIYGDVTIKTKSSLATTKLPGQIPLGEIVISGTASVSSAAGKKVPVTNDSVYALAT